MRLIAFLAASALLLSGSQIHAAKAPKSTATLETRATQIVRGKVIEVATKVGQSKIETSPGIHKDTIYTITVQVEELSKGHDATKGERITVQAWQPHTRKPNPPGRQGHEPIPTKGETSTFHLTGGEEKTFAAITPTGIRIETTVSDKAP
jgi:hypothetical protein